VQVQADYPWPKERNESGRGRLVGREATAKRETVAMAVIGSRSCPKSRQPMVLQARAGLDAALARGGAEVETRW
jgi:hypothetical protein